MYPETAAGGPEVRDIGMDVLRLDADVPQLAVHLVLDAGCWIEASPPVPQFNESRAQRQV
jgi:hypothetical protein